MIVEALNLLKSKKMILQGLAFFGFFMFIYTLIDGFNLSYTAMAGMYGSTLVVINIGLNILMASLSAFLLNLSTAMAALKGKESKGSNLSFFSVLFGILTYGCTPCVIGFFASIGVAFSVIALPLAGLPYKLISLLLIVIGILWTVREINVGQCKVNYSK